jgi:L-lactate transport
MRMVIKPIFSSLFEPLSEEKMWSQKVNICKNSTPVELHLKAKDLAGIIPPHVAGIACNCHCQRGSWMAFALTAVWPQPLDPLNSVSLSALAATVPLTIVLILMGVFRRSGLLASFCGLFSAGFLAFLIWRMPLKLALWSVFYGFLFAAWSILWIVFNALWLYNISIKTGSFDLLRRWMEQHAPADPCIQAILVAFSFGALLEGSAGFGAPVAVTAFLLLGLGFERQRAVVVSLVANTAPVAFGALGVPIIALAGVTGLDLAQLSAMVGRQLPLLSFLLPAYLAVLVAGWAGLRRSWPVAFVAGGSFAVAQFVVSNTWGPFVTDVIASIVSIASVVAFLRVWRTRRAALPSQAQPSTENQRPPGLERLSFASSFFAWLPWVWLSLIMIVWSYFGLFRKGQLNLTLHQLHNQILITLYQKPYSAIFGFQPLAGGTAVLVASVLTALCFRVSARDFATCGTRALRQLIVPGLTVFMIVGLAYLYNYSGMAYTLGAAVAGVGSAFPIVSSYLGWIACFLSGSDTASNVLFGNLQVAAAHNLHLSEVLMAATNSSGAVTGKMISPQNIAVGVTTVALIGQEGTILRLTFWHSIALAGLLGVLAFAQAHWLSGMVP